MPIADKRIFFGHQSVGANIIAGIHNLPIAEKLHIVESRTLPDQSGPCFLHAPVGKNRDPGSKIQDFVSVMNDGLGNSVDIACLKFCYIDIDRNTNVESLFADYQKAMNELSATFTETRFLHLTTPIRTVEPKVWLFVKGLLGKKSLKLADNLNRQAFNELMIKNYADKEPIFDLAKKESTFPNGKRCSSALGGNLVYSLVPEYTDDGGHLNKQGQHIIAQQFVDTINQIN